MVVAGVHGVSDPRGHYACLRRLSAECCRSAREKEPKYNGAAAL